MTQPSPFFAHRRGGPHALRAAAGQRPQRRCNSGSTGTSPDAVWKGTESCRQSGTRLGTAYAPRGFDAPKWVQSLAGKVNTWFTHYRQEELRHDHQESDQAAPENGSSPAHDDAKLVGPDGTRYAKDAVEDAERRMRGSNDPDRNDDPAAVAGNDEAPDGTHYDKPAAEEAERRLRGGD